MKKTLLLGKIWNATFANDNDAYIPEIWAAEGLMILENNTVAAQLVHRDFSPEIQEFGDVVNTRRPQSFQMERKTDADNVNVQDAISQNVQVPLNQHGHVSFTIKDGEQSKSFEELVRIYLNPAMIAMSDGVDQVILNQAYQFLPNTVGALGTPVDKSTMIALDEMFNGNQVPVNDRHLVVPPSQKADLLEVDDFTHLDKITEGGVALRTAHLGPLMSFATWMDQNAPHPSTPLASTAATTTDLAASAGATTLPVAATAGVVGQWLTVVGDDTPQLITAVSAADSYTIFPGLKFDVANGAAVVYYQIGDVNGAQVIGYAKNLVWDGLDPAGAPSKGAAVAFAASTGSIYGLLNNPSVTGGLLDRPLDVAIADNEVIGFGPAGSYGAAWHRNAIALVSRPLALPMEGTGARSAVINVNGLSMRVTMTYDGNAQGTLVTLDMLFGVAVLDQNLGGILLGS